MRTLGTSSRRVRLAIVAVLAVHMQLGGVVHQLLRYPALPTTMSWQMYSGVGVTVCEATWYRAEGDELVPVDRVAVMGYPTTWKAPDSIKLLPSSKDVDKAAKALCAKLPGADIRVDARCGKGPRVPWVQAVRTDRAMCAAKPAKPKRVAP